MIWRMTIEVPTELEERIRLESFKTKTPVSQLVNNMLADRYGLKELIKSKGRKSRLSKQTFTQASSA